MSVSLANRLWWQRPPRHSGRKKMICKRFALVGSGFIGQVHAASLARHEGSALT
ncbi:oxidoreductase, partial [Klebsiella pneumoniae]